MVKIMITSNKWSCAMRFYDGLKAKLESTQQNMVEAKKKVKEFCTEFGFTAELLKCSLAEGRKIK
jgi:hypothetical protein